MSGVSVITLNKGRSDHLIRLIEGLSRGMPPTECIIVQFGADSFREGNTLFDVRNVHLSHAGLPLAAARNAGRAASCGDVLIFLDVDCIPSADLMTVMADQAADCDALICCPVSYLASGAVGDSWTEEQLLQVGKRHPARIFPACGLEKGAHAGLFWSLAFAVRAATFDRIGGFDESFLGYGAEDTDFAYRADALDVPVMLSARGHAFHQHHSAYDPPLHHFSDIMRNARRFRRKHGVWPMRGWIDAFGSLGLVAETEDGDFIVLRQPTPGEIDAAMLPDNRPF